MQDTSLQQPTPQPTQLIQTDTSKKHNYLIFSIINLILGIGIGVVLEFFLFLPSPKPPISQPATIPPKAHTNQSNSVFGYPLKNYPVAGTIIAETNVPAFIASVNPLENGTFEVVLRDDEENILTDTISISPSDNVTYFYDPITEKETPLSIQSVQSGDKVDLYFTLDQTTLSWKLAKLRKLEK